VTRKKKGPVSAKGERGYKRGGENILLKKLVTWHWLSLSTKQSVWSTDSGNKRAGGGIPKSRSNRKRKKRELKPESPRN